MSSLLRRALLVFPVCLVAFVACTGDPAPAMGIEGGPGHEAGIDAGPGVDGDAPAGRHAVLFVGNSYTYTNDVPGHYRALLGGVFPASRTELAAPGGYRLTDHARDAAKEGTDLARWLGVDDFDFVVLQEQSQIGGFYANDAERTASIAGAIQLSALARAHGATTVLYATWGRAHGDPSNFGYETFASMQARLDEGYLNMASILREQGSKVLLAPVGAGFRVVFDDLVRAGADPLAAGSDFEALYESDGSHPSAQGAYLAACILAATIAPSGIARFADDPALGAQTSGRLRSACTRTVADPRWTIPTLVRPDAVLKGDGVASGNVGESVALSADGSRALVGAVGSARVFLRSGATWSEEIAWRNAPPFGSPVALSGDGAWALVAPTRAYGRAGTTWTQSPTVLPLVNRGGSTALSADGSRAVVALPGGPEVGADVPIARIWIRSGTEWSEEAPVLGRSTAGFAAAVAIDGAGLRIVVGEHPSRVLVRNGSTWATEATLPVDGGPVALSADGATVLVGVPFESRVLVFRRVGTAWSQIAALVGPANRFFGGSVALSADGSRAVVGASMDLLDATGLSSSGSVKVYDLGAFGARQSFVLAPRTGPGTEATNALAQFGVAASISGDGTTVLVGARAATGYVGEATVFTLR
jgi:hypothetical protein